MKVNWYHFFFPISDIILFITSPGLDPNIKLLLFPENIYSPTCPLSLNLARSTAREYSYNF